MSIQQHQHQADTQHEEEEEGDYEGMRHPWEAEALGVGGGGQWLGPDVLLHGLGQVVLPGTEAQLSAGLVDLEGVAHRYVYHLESGEMYGQLVSRWLAKG